MIILIDNYDSFTYNLVQYIGELGADVKVFRNDAITLEKIKKMKPSHIVISPGPGRPNDAGISKSLIKHLGDNLPILGVCLGHQCIAEVYGGDVVEAKNLMHGKVSKVYHNNKGIFKGLRNPFDGTRYHSLIVKRSTLPDCFEITAQTADKEIMGIRHKNLPVCGVQFHPESIFTKEGKKLLRNFIKNAS